MEFLLSSSAVFSLGMLFVVGALGAILFARLGSERFAGQWSYGCCLFASLLGLGIAGVVIFSGQGIVVDTGTITALVPFSLRVDILSAFFLAVTSLVAVCTSLYAIAYQEHFAGRYPLWMLGCFYSIFVGSLAFVVMANHALTFLFFWEVMSLSSYLLVVYEHREKENTRAGFLYFVMTHIGTACIVLAFVLGFAATNSFSFDAWRAGLSSTAPLIQGLVLLAALIGFGIKAGVVPLHIWLPEAHPAAPSHVSALMSGVMIKAAVFMLIRFFFEFLPGSSLWWGVAILVLGGVSSVLGAMYALAEYDLKRFLAFSSVENIGVILLGVGAAVVFAASGMQNLALIALAAALFHTMNHAVFKALLFLGAGSVVSATGTRNMEKYGGLIKLLPYTAGFFLVGSLAIAAFPPLNGFASEWLTFQALFAGLVSPIMSVKIGFMFGIASLALTGGLAAAGFVKAFGVTFLARSRSDVRAGVHEAALPMLIGMGILAAFIASFGIFAVPISSILVGVAASLGHTTPATTFQTSGFFAAPENSSGMLPLMTVATVFLALAILVVLLVSMATRRNKVVYGPTWDCGMPLTSRMEITATSISRSLIVIFKGILRHTKQVSIEYHDEASRYFTKSHAVSVGFFDPYRAHLYDPIHHALLSVASRVRRIQGGIVNVYVLYVFATVIALLIFATST